jgi:antitoxin component of RelBE/YafQ-DinJ toxin-antitoxin module
MSQRKQTRRSISIKGETYERLRTYCRTHGLSMSGVVEALVVAKLANADQMPVEEEIAKTAQPYRDVDTRPKAKTKAPASESEISKALDEFFPGGVHSF